MSGKIKARKPDPSGKIRAKPPKGKEEVRWCFRYFNPQHTKFNFSCCDENFLKKFLTRLKHYSRLKVQEIRQSRSRSIRSNPIQWEKTSESGGFGLHEQLGDDEAYELTVSQSLGRFHGFFNGNIFFIVWLDLDHELFP